MKLVDILNLTAADIKANRKEAEAAVKEVTKAELDARFIPLLIDAKLRDEKLAEQGKTISDYQERCEEHKQRITELEKALTKANTSLEQVSTKASELHNKSEAVIRELKRELDEVTNKALKAEAKAKSRRKGLADLAAIINPLLAEEDSK